MASIRLSVRSVADNDAISWADNDDAGSSSSSVVSCRNWRVIRVIIGVLVLVTIVVMAVLLPTVILKQDNVASTGNTSISNNSVTGDWGEWGVWSVCSSTCNGGIESRNRSCHISRQLTECLGNSSQERMCNTEPCPVTGDWGEWGVWSVCSSTCNGGVESRNRSCHINRQLTECLGNSSQERMCNTEPCPVNGSWTEWTAWSVCSVTCGGGIFTRNRFCDNPAPANGGLRCSGPSRENDTCNDADCPVPTWSDWGSWSACSSSCGHGMKRRTRVCDTHGDQLPRNYCFGDSTYIEMCLIKQCPVDGGWTAWTFWSSCSGICGTAKTTRQRFCTNPTPANGGSDCSGSQTEHNACNVANCPISDCKDVLQNGIGTTDGVYSVTLAETGKVIDVYCDMTTGGGGWTVFQRRVNGSVDFYRTFDEYENGFGSVYGEFWLGLKNIYEMTKGMETELRIDLEKSTGEKGFGLWQLFSLSGPLNYVLQIGAYSSGTIGDWGGLHYNNNSAFSTFDRDVDSYSITNCAEERHGAWWYRNCTAVNLNGHYATPGTESPYLFGLGGVTYFDFDDTRSLKSTSMKFRRKK